ncbi:MAG: helix-turn-helix domain-containing protein [Betaproteobacteria bacterium]|nr:helix-turn-helix domain-containing protein [Betaproteobacteria bacterium]
MSENREPVAVSLTMPAANSDTESVPVIPSQPPLGELLRQGREARHLSLADVAQMLKISARQVEALERDNWSALPGQTFVRGFVRNYARLVQLDADALVARLNEDAAPEVPNIVMPQASTAELPQPGHGKRRDFVAVIAAVLMVGVALAAYFLVPVDFWEKKPVEEPAARAEVVPVTAAEAQAQAADNGTAAPSASVPAPARAPGAGDPAVAGPATANQPPAVAAPTAAVASASDAPVSQGRGRFTFRFEQAAWVEVKDRTGQIIFSQLSPAGSEREVDGVPPFSMVVGNASHVKLTYKGREVPLEPRSKDDVARVTLD